LNSSERRNGGLRILLVNMTDAPNWKDTAVRATMAAIPWAGGTLQVLYDDPVVEALFVNAVDSAIRNGLDSKRRLLAQAVASAVLNLDPPMRVVR